MVKFSVKLFQKPTPDNYKKYKLYDEYSKYGFTVCSNTKCLCVELKEIVKSLSSFDI